MKNKPGRRCKGTGQNRRGEIREWVKYLVYGIGSDWWSICCEACGEEFFYNTYETAPCFCDNCGDKKLKKPCGQMGCNNTISYRLGWADVPIYCRSCRTKHYQGWFPSLCTGIDDQGCYKLVWSPPGNERTLCPDCIAKKNLRDRPKWQTKTCAFCGGKIRYNKDWDSIPNYCQTCNELQTKLCALCHYNQIKYKLYWSNIPVYCQDCQKKLKEARGQEHYILWDSFGTSHWIEYGLPKYPPVRSRDLKE